MITIPSELAADLRDFLSRQALSPQSSARDAEALLARLEAGEGAAPDAEPDPFAAFRESEKELAKEIATRTGVVPMVVKLTDEKTRRPYEVLRFWVRDRDGETAFRDVDLSEFHEKEGVKHALRVAIRAARLDHVGPALTGAWVTGVVEKEPEPTPPPDMVTSCIFAGYEQALSDFGIDTAGEDYPEGWQDRSRKRLPWGVK